MARSMEYRRDMRNRKIRKRKRKIIYTKCYWAAFTSEPGYPHGKKIYNALYNDKDGYFNKGYYGAVGSGRKTKTKNVYTGCHHKGHYGKAVVYSRHDKSQIEHMDIALKDYYNNEEEIYFDSTT